MSARVSSPVGLWIFALAFGVGPIACDNRPETSHPPQTTASAALQPKPPREPRRPRAQPRAETDCRVPMDCSVIAGSCCDCVNAKGAVAPRAVNRGGWVRHQKTCAIKECPACDGGLVGAEPDFVATCKDDKCQVVDVRGHELSACKTANDCMLTTSTCCGCEGEPIAINKEQQALKRDLLCGKNTQCAPCRPAPYDGLSVACEQGHCVRQGTRQRRPPR